VRAFLSLVPEIIPANAHGLKWHSSKSLFGNTAEIQKGTFFDYLKAMGCDFSLDEKISLEQALSRIPEISIEYLLRDRRVANAIPVYVRGFQSGKLYLQFDEGFVDRNDFATSWKSWFPQLADSCKLIEDSAILLVDRGNHEKYETVCEYCSKHLENRLTYSDVPLWYIIKKEGTGSVLPRLSYYIISLFILGSIVRYEPELLEEIEVPNSEIGWLIDEFLQRAERYSPQLLLQWLYGDQVYFG
jgi:hypothetical protein